MSYHQKTVDAARGKWKGIMLSLGMADSYLTGKPGPCPICQDGTDRWVFDNKAGSGSWLCRKCDAAGHGLELVMRFLGLDFAQAAAKVDAILGNETIGTETGKSELDDEAKRAALRQVAGQTVRMVPGDLADRYLTSRHVGELVYPRTLRFAAALRDGEGGIHPAMVATVQDQHGANVTLHRTFLRSDGLAKAEIKAPRKLMPVPGELPDGACVRLAEHQGVLGIAEGIETALAASVLFHVPVWAALTARMLHRWLPPEHVEEVVIFGDSDASFTGHSASYGLAHKLAVTKKLREVTVQIPGDVGHDWSDVLRLRREIEGQRNAS